MSISFQTSDGREIAAAVLPLAQDGEIQIGEYEIPLEQFADVAGHLLGGGLAGWPDHLTPASVDKTLSHLFDLYERVDGKWVRKEKYRIRI